MSEIKALEKLRECAEHSSDGWFVNLEQAFGLRRYRCGDSTVKPDGGAILNAIADAIQAEVDERFMELPLDADGVPIRVGDTIETNANGYAGTFDVFAIGHNTVVGNHDVGWIRKNPSKWFHVADYCHHVKPRTIEDVLTDLTNEVAKQGHQIGLTANEIIAKYADEIRELMWVGE